MLSHLVEKAARAICAVHGQDPDEDAPLGMICGGANEPLPWWMYYEEDGRAAVAALLPVPPSQGAETEDQRLVTGREWVREQMRRVLANYRCPMPVDAEEAVLDAIVWRPQPGQISNAMQSKITELRDVHALLLRTKPEGLLYESVMPCMLETADLLERFLFRAQPHPAVNELVEALRPLMPITVTMTPDYAELGFGHCQTQAITMEPDTWTAIDAAWSAFQSHPEES